MHAPFWIAVLQIIFVNIILSGDNAVVIAMACLTLPPKQRLWGMILGAGVAVLLRVVFTIVIAQAMAYPFLKLVGGALLFYVAIKLVSSNVYQDAIWALGMMIAFYYGLTGFASAIYYRHVLLRSVKNLLFMGVVPLLGGLVLVWAFVASAMDMADPANSYSGADLFGIGMPLAITIITFIIGAVLMVLWWVRSPAFFRQRPTAYHDHEGVPPVATPLTPAPHAGHGA
jgi:hypothetical protein